MDEHDEFEDYYGKYPFLDDAQEMVGEIGADLAEIAGQDSHPVVERAVERVRSSIEEKNIGERADDMQIELLSYPMARILVSLLDEQAAIRRYIQAESKSAFESLQKDWQDTEATTGDNDETSDRFQGTGSAKVTLNDLFDEFDISGAVEEVSVQDKVFEADYRVEAATYILLASEKWDDEWSLVNKTVKDGYVYLTEAKTQELIESAIQQDVGEPLPFDVPDALAKELDAEIEELREVLRDTDLLREVDTVAPDLFPPCMKKLLEKVRDGDHLEHHARFALTTFLTNIGMTTDEIVELYKVNSEFGEEMTRYQTDHIQGNTGPVEYSAPSCATMKTHGDCYNPDELCSAISHPMSYYEAKLDDAEEDDQSDLTDWREEADLDTSDADGEKPDTDSDEENPEGADTGQDADDE